MACKGHLPSCEHGRRLQLGLFQQSTENVLHGIDREAHVSEGVRIRIYVVKVPLFFRSLISSLCLTDIIQFAFLWVISMTFGNKIF